MSARRLASTSLVMALAGALLLALAPAPSATIAFLRHPQAIVDTAGPDAAALVVVGALTWLVWGWAVLGLVLTAASALPGAVGALAGHLVRAVLPAAARQGAALALGLGVGIGASLAATAPAAANAPAASASSSGLDWPRLTVPDWPEPGAPATPASEGPASEGPAPHPTDAAPPQPPAAIPAADVHVVVRGDCLWSIAAGRLHARIAKEPSDREVAAAVQAWWETNESIIGPDPDLLLPGQVLHPPPPH